jgi:hypothetical protein
MLASSRTRTWWMLGITAFCYLYVFPYQSQLNNPNENVRLYMTAALVEEGQYAIDGMRERWGWVNDAAAYGGHLYSVKAPGTSLLGVPAYAGYLAFNSLLGRDFDRTEALWACRVVASVLPMLLWLFALHRWLGRGGRDPALVDAVYLSVALGSLLYGYSLLFVSHAVSAASAFGAFMLLHDAQHEQRRGPGRMFAAGLLCAFTTLFEYPGFVASVLLAAYAVYVLRRPRALLPFVVGGLGPLFAMLHFQHSAFGNPFTPGHLYVETDALREAHHEGLYGATGLSGEALFGLTLDPGAGLLPLTPVLVFAFVGYAVLLRERRHRVDAGVSLAIFVLTLLAISSMNNWRGGWTIGPRYLALTVPFVAWAALEGLERVAERLPMGALALALGGALTAFVLSGAPSAYYPHLPPEFTRPVSQLIAVLVAHGFAPHNAGNLLGLHGTLSMLPLALAALLGLGLCLTGVRGRRTRLAIVGMSLAVAGGLLVPLTLRPAREPGVAKAVAFVTRRWAPAGHDAAATLAARLRSGRALRDEELRELAALYAAEGREREAKRALKGRP